MINRHKEFHTYMNSIGVKNNPSIYKWSVQTNLGPLYVDVWDSDFTKSGAPKIRGKACYSIFTRFEKMNDEIKDFINKFDNRTSTFVNGKWNFHYPVNSVKDWDYLFEWFRYEIEQIMEKH